ncbi:NADP-dependent oxidoreductase [Occallatibacter riparius]|uniref:NADP-dependent oxidoreductase n=1 Tax=Occallatibacter riparius TaxID=1002689 RepID=A0A9J7BLI8_9BACT|nr:NADP-dependent oxidoreductase [Occallatibacter riparius]UWZ83329.1 NADP-dependent oxidoreductase [Occallatibacter riparius]
MPVMRAIEITDTLAPRSATRPVPEPQPGEILIQVSAAAVTPTELQWYPTTHNPDGSARHNAIPGHEFAGTVAKLGQGVTGYKTGDSVFGFNDWFAEGATAEFCIAKSSQIAPKPSSLSEAQAASAPISVLTAWQGLHLRSKLQNGERILIHGASGAVGLYAVQLAKSLGAYVIATSSKANIEFVKQLGADEAIDYRASRFEDAGPVDVVFDSVGGETLDRSWNILKPGGRLVTIAAQSESTTDPRVKDAFFIVEQDRAQLAELAKRFDDGGLRAFVKAEIPLEEADRAYRGTIDGPPGKIVIRP